MVTSGIIIGSAILGLTSAFSLYAAMRKLRTAGRIADTATSKIRSVAIGFAELEGTAKEGTEKLIAPFSKRPCFYHLIEIERYEEHGSGKDRKRHWTPKLQETRSTAFRLDDGTGAINVRAEEAECNVAPDKRWYLKRGSRFTIGRWRESEDAIIGFGAQEIEPNARGRSMVGDWRFTERVISPDERIYALGTVRRDGDTVSIGHDPAHGPFVLSDRGEGKVLGTYRLHGWLLLGFGLVCAGVVYFLLTIP